MTGRRHTLNRTPAIFWHNIAYRDDGWWAFLRDHGQLAAGFDNRPGDRGEQLLRRYIAGDRIVAYVSGFGAVGWGLVEEPDSYRLLKIGDPADVRPDHGMRHRIDVTWSAAAPYLKRALSAGEIRERFGVPHPPSTSLRIRDQDAAARLLEHLTAQFSNWVQGAQTAG